MATPTKRNWTSLQNANGMRPCPHQISTNSRDFPPKQLEDSNNNRLYKVLLERLPGIFESSDSDRETECNTSFDSEASVYDDVSEELESSTKIKIAEELDLAEQLTHEDWPSCFKIYAPSYSNNNPSRDLNGTVRSFDPSDITAEQGTTNLLEQCSGPCQKRKLNSAEEQNERNKKFKRFKTTTEIQQLCDFSFVRSSSGNHRLWQAGDQPHAGPHPRPTNALLKSLKT